MSTKHTKGPWRISGNRREVYANDPHGFTGAFVVADCSGREAFGPMTTTHHPEMAEANALLISAAPDLLAAIRSARQTLISAIGAGCDLPDFDATEHVTIKEIDAAIAKAEGRAAAPHLTG